MFTQGLSSITTIVWESDKNSFKSIMMSVLDLAYLRFIDFRRDLRAACGFLPII